MRYLALGDSYTIGEAVLEAERFPVRLRERLREGGCADLAPPQIIATTGWTTNELSTGIDAAAPAGPFDLVTLLIGVNNQYRGWPLDEYRQEFAGLLRRAIGFAGGEPGRVIVISIPDWGVTPFAAGQDRERIATEIDTFNRANATETSLQGARYLDITPLSRMALQRPELTASDGLHPSGELYRLWVERILPEALAALRS